MGNSFITYDDVYLLLKPFSINFDMVLFAVILILILVMAYNTYKEKLSSPGYVLIAILIVINSIFIPLFLGRMNMEIKRFINLSDQDAVKEIVSADLTALNTFFESKHKNDLKIYLCDPSDSYYENVKIKFRLAYYLAPIILADNPEEANYLVVTNYDSKSKIILPIGDRKHKVHKISDHILVIELTSTNAEKKGVDQ